MSIFSSIKTLQSEEPRLCPYLAASRRDSGATPPKKEAQPTQAEIAAFVTQLDTRFKEGRASRMAAHTRTVHLKDIAFEEAPEGFRMAEVPLGQGSLGLPGIVKTIRQANPKVRFQLEMITRDPLLIPCLQDK